MRNQRLRTARTIGRRTRYRPQASSARPIAVRICCSDHLVRLETGFATAPPTFPGRPVRADSPNVVTTEEFFGSFDFFDSFVFDAIASRYPPRSAANHDWRFLPSARGEAGDPRSCRDPVVPATAHKDAGPNSEPVAQPRLLKGTLGKRRLAGGLKSEDLGEVRSTSWGSSSTLRTILWHRTPRPSVARLASLHWIAAERTRSASISRRCLRPPAQSAVR